MNIQPDIVQYLAWQNSSELNKVKEWQHTKNTWEVVTTRRTEENNNLWSESFNT